MNYHNKQMIVNELIKVVDSSPTKLFPSKHLYPGGNLYPGQNPTYGVSTQELDIWVNYVNSVLDISYQYANFPMILSAKSTILQIYGDNRMSCIERVMQIERIILNLAQSILNC